MSFNLEPTLEHVINQLMLPDNMYHFESSLRYLADFASSLPSLEGQAQALNRVHEAGTQMHHELTRYYLTAPSSFPTITIEQANVEVVYRILNEVQRNQPADEVTSLYQMADAIRTRAQNNLSLLPPDEVEADLMELMSYIDERYHYNDVVLCDGSHAIALPSLECKAESTSLVLEEYTSGVHHGIGTIVIISADVNKYGSPIYQLVQSVANAIALYIYSYADLKKQVEELLNGYIWSEDVQGPRYYLLVNLISHALVYNTPYWDQVVDRGKLVGATTADIQQWQAHLSELLTFRDEEVESDII